MPQNDTTSNPEAVLLEVEATPLDLTPEEMRALEEEAEMQARAEQEAKENTLAGLAMSIEGKFKTRSSNRKIKETQWMRSSRLYLGSLSIDRRWSSTGDGKDANRPTRNLVKEKCRVALAQTISSQFSNGEKNWDLKPPKKSQDPNAASKASAMEAEIYTQLDETSYGPKVRKAMEDWINMGTGIIKGPVPSREPKLAYDIIEQPDGSIITVPKYEMQAKPEVYHVSPWFAYPDDSVTDPCLFEDFIEIHPMGRTQLAKLALNPGFFKETIAEVLETEAADYNHEVFTDIQALTEAGENFLKNKYVVMEYHGPISAKDLQPLGLEAAYDSLENSYYGEIWTVNGKVIRAELEAISGAYEIPYCFAVWLGDPNSPFGFSLPLEIEDPQRIMSATVHMVMDNTWQTSGSQVVVNKEFINPMDGKWELAPGKLWEVTDSTLQDIRQAFNDYTVPNTTPAMLPIMELAESWAHQESGMPGLGGQQSSGVESATGMVLQDQQSTTTIDMKSQDWGDMVTQKLIWRMYHWNMQYNPKPEIIGDFEVDVRSRIEIRNSQAQLNNLEKLSVEVSQNPALGEWVNVEALAQARLAGMGIPNTNIIKTPDQVAAEREAAAQNPPPPDPEMLKIEIEQQKLELEKQSQETKRMEIEYKMQGEMQKHQLEMANRAEAIEARKYDAQVRAIESQTEMEMKMMEMAMKNDQMTLKEYMGMEKTQAQINANKFIKGMEVEVKSQDRAAHLMEMQLKRDTGSGV